MQKIEDVIISTAVPEEIIKQQILDARKLNLAPITTLFDWREGRPIALVGGGPSLPNFHEQIRNNYETTIACGSVHDYLFQNGIIPRYSLVCDPDSIMSQYLKYSFEVSEVGYNTEYLVASQCHKDVFKQLKGNNVYLWDCGGSPEFNYEMFKDKHNIIPGGCTVGTRAIFAAIAMGYKNIHLYGFDCCIDGDKHHAYEFQNPEVETIGNITEIKLDNPDSPTFKVAGYMLAQAFDFQRILESYAGQLNIEVFGGGLLAEFLKIGKQRALEQKGI